MKCALLLRDTSDAYNIPNDNLVEILVHRLKAKLQSQGSNVTYESARKSALTLQIQDEIRENLIQKSGLKKSGITLGQPVPTTTLFLW